MFVLSIICISSTDIIGGSSIGFFVIKGKLIAAIRITNKCKEKEIITFLVTIYLSLYGSEIKATLVNPEPDSMPIISKTLP